MNSRRSSGLDMRILRFFALCIWRFEKLKRKVNLHYHLFDLYRKAERYSLVECWFFSNLTIFSKGWNKSNFNKIFDWVCRTFWDRPVIFYETGGSWAQKLTKSGKNLIFRWFAFEKYCFRKFCVFCVFLRAFQADLKKLTKFFKLLPLTHEISDQPVQIT